MEPQATVPATSANWPGAFGAFKAAKNAYMLNVGPNLTILAVSIVLSIALPQVLGNGGRLLSEVIAIILSVASVPLYLAGARGQKLALGSAFPKDLMLYAKFIGLSILVALSFLGSFLLLVIPFFFVAPRLVLATYFLIDKDMGVVEAYKASWAATKGQAGKVWGIFGASIAFGLLCLVLIGIYLSIMYSTIYALLYVFLLQQRPVSQVNPVTAPSPTPQV